MLLPFGRRWWLCGSRNALHGLRGLFGVAHHFPVCAFGWEDGERTLRFSSTRVSHLDLHGETVPVTLV